MQNKYQAITFTSSVGMKMEFWKLLRMFWGYKKKPLAPMISVIYLHTMLLGNASQVFDLKANSCWNQATLWMSSSVWCESISHVLNPWSMMII